MKAISLIEPWASLVAHGQKRNETRSWPAPKWAIGRRFAIHASKSQVAIKDGTGAKLWALTKLPAFNRWGRGEILAVVTLTGCTPTELVRDRVDELEKAFGNYGGGRFAWHFDDLRRLVQPIPCKGMLGLWTVPPEIELQLLEAGK